MKKTILHMSTALILAAAGITCAAATPEALEFAAASIKSNGSGNESMAFGCHGTDTARANMLTQSGASSGKRLKVVPALLGSCAATNASLKMLLAYAYNLDAAPDQVDSRVLFGPGWAATARFDIEAKAEKPVPEADLRVMLRALLADKFKLQIRRETQEDLGYGLVVAPGGAKLNPPRNNVQMSAGRGPIAARPVPGGVTVISTSRQQTLSIPWAQMSNFANFLSLRLRKPVVDQTHLTGTYDITLILPPIGNGGDGLGPLLIALPDQLGLRLVAQKVSTETIIIDDAEELLQNPANAFGAEVRRSSPQRSTAAKIQTATARSLGCKPELSAQAQAQLSTVTRPLVAALSAGQAPPDLEAVLSRAGTYVAEYEAQLGNLIGEEVYVQNDAPVKDMKFGISTQRRTEADFSILHIGTDWIGVREVNCLDGVKVTGKVQNFQKILDDSPAAVVNNINNALNESARYNIGVIQRNSNLPTLALRILRPDNVRRFEFKKDGEATIDGVRTWTVVFHEIQGPTMIKDDDQDEFATGLLWIDPETGQILKTEVSLAIVQGQNSFRSQTVVSYKKNPKLELLVPASMEEHYDTNGSRKLDCRADYFNFHRFEVETHFDFGPLVPSPRPSPNRLDTFFQDFH